MAPLSAADALPYLTADLPGIGGRIKEHLADFRVTEVPLYEPSGEGTHVYFLVTKAGITSHQAADRIARHMGVDPHEVGLAGLKDARAVTTQMMSLDRADPAALAACRDAKMSVEVLGLHGNKLRPGHLRANRFAVRIRGAGAAHHTLQRDDMRIVLEPRVQLAMAVAPPNTAVRIKANRGL